MVRISLTRERHFHGLTLLQCPPPRMHSVEVRSQNSAQDAVGTVLVLLNELCPLRFRETKRLELPNDGGISIID